MKIKQELRRFLRAHYSQGRELLLALSGGPDSQALFHLLVEFRYPFRVAHVDHAWRPESAKEAKALEELCRQHKIPFHLKTLNPDEMQGNLEDACRQERLSYFQELSTQWNCQAVVLGHHADDQAETVLKRLFEGASLEKLAGIRSVGRVSAPPSGIGQTSLTVPVQFRIN